MTLLVAVVLVVAITTLFTLFVRAKDIPPPEPESPTRHLDERKAAIYENLRDLQFEYRVGKLSDADYQSTKKDLQKELAGVLGEVDRLKAQLNGVPPAPDQPRMAVTKKTSGGFTCAACGAKFEKELKYCGECGKPMKAVKA